MPRCAEPVADRLEQAGGDFLVVDRLEEAEEAAVLLVKAVVGVIEMAMTRPTGRPS